MSYRLFYSPGAASFAVHWMLIHLGERVELVLTRHDDGSTRTPEFLKLNPSGHVPVLVAEDGAPRAEAAALLMWLAEQHPQSGLDVPAGAPARADYLQTMLFLANTAMPAFRAWFYPWEPAGPDQQEAARAQARPRIEAVWDRLDARLSDGRAHLLGEGLSAADFLATMLTRWSRAMPRPATDWPRLKAYVDRMRALRSLREAHAREGLSDWIDG